MKRRIAFLLMTVASLFFWDRSLYAVLDPDRPESPAAQPAATGRAHAQQPAATQNQAQPVSPAATDKIVPAIPVRIDLAPPADWYKLPCVKRDLEVRGA